jgi:hypothetical protein
MGIHCAVRVVTGRAEGVIAVVKPSVLVFAGASAGPQHHTRAPWVDGLRSPPNHGVQVRHPWLHVQAAGIHTPNLPNLHVFLVRALLWRPRCVFILVNACGWHRLDRMIPGKLEPIKGVGDKSPLPVSPSLYNPDRIRRTPPSSPGDTQLPCSPILSAMGEQVSSLKATRPRTVFGSSRKLPPTKPVVCDKLYNTSEAATHVLPRPATVTCNVKGRPGLHDRKVPGQDYDFMPSDSPGNNPVKHHPCYPPVPVLTMTRIVPC